MSCRTHKKFKKKNYKKILQKLDGETLSTFHWFNIRVSASDSTKTKKNDFVFELVNVFSLHKNDKVFVGGQE